MAKLVEKAYGDALFDIAIESDRVDALFSETKDILLVLEENDELVKLLNHPKINKVEKKKVIENVFKGNVSDDMTGFLVLIVEKDRQRFLSKILGYFISRIKEYKKIGVVYVSTAIELTDSQKGAVLKKLISTTQYNEFEVFYDIDKSLIGGMVIRIGDRVIDSTIKTKIEKLSKELYNVQLTKSI